MRPVLPLILCATVTITGCSRISESRINPLNWFGRSEAVTPVQDQAQLRPLVGEGQGIQVVDARGLVGTVVALNVDRTPDGAIVRATGTTTATGQYNAQLVPTDVEGGILTLAFRVQSPGTSANSTIEPRQITAAYLMSNAALASIRSIRVQGSQNALISRR